MLKVGHRVGSSTIRGEHYNTRRPHRGRRLRPPRPESVPDEPEIAAIDRHPILGGLISEYTTPPSTKPAGRVLAPHTLIAAYRSMVALA